MPGFVIFQAFTGKPCGYEFWLNSERYGAPFGWLFDQIPIAGFWAALILLFVSCRVNIYLPHKWFARLFSFLAGGALIAFFFVPGLIIKDQSMLDVSIKVFEAVDIPLKERVLLSLLPVAGLILLGLAGFIALPNILGIRGMLRSRLAILAGLMFLLIPLVAGFVGISNIEDHLIKVLNLTRFYIFFIGFLFVFTVGASSFIGNLLINMNYNERMLASAD